jgi:hypothetical protein
METTTLTPSQRVMRANAALIEKGGRRMPGGYLQPDAAQALADLIAAGYAGGAVAVISAALLDAQRKLGRASPSP